MKLDMKDAFRLAFITGVSLLFSSLFLDWYVLHVFNSEQEIIASWRYNLFIGWYTSLPKESFNALVEPRSIEISPFIQVVFFCILIVTVFGASFIDVDTVKSFNNAKKIAIINLFLIVLNLFYLIVVPIVFFIPNDLLFPFAIKSDFALNFKYHYSIGPAYIAQIFGFMFCFPYSIFYYQTILKFEMDASAPNKILLEYIESVKEPLDLDKYLAEEQLKLRFSEDHEMNSNEFMNEIKKERII